MIAAKIVADSVNHHGDRLTTFELTMPKSLVAQFNTHRMIARNSASSRAIPTAKVIEQVTKDPYVTPSWRYRAKGMQAGGPLDANDIMVASKAELDMRAAVLKGVRELERIGAAKEDINRYLEPWVWTTVVATATEWENYFKQRDHEDTQSAHAQVARLMREAMDASAYAPRYGEYAHNEADYWHLPYVTDDERYTLRPEILPRLSAVRCARVSYGRAGVATDVMDELRRYEDFPRLGHWSPLEMPCRADNERATACAGCENGDWWGPFKGWRPLRKFYGGESGTDRHGWQEDDKRWTEL